MKNLICKFKKIYLSFALLLTNILFPKIIYAGGIQGSNLVKGTEKLIQDATSVGLVLAPIIAGLAGLFCAIRLSTAEEQDKKMWQDRLKRVFIGFILAISIVGLIKVIAGYYGS